MRYRLVLEDGGDSRPVAQSTLTFGADGSIEVLTGADPAAMDDPVIRGVTAVACRDMWKAFGYGADTDGGGPFFDNAHTGKETA